MTDQQTDGIGGAHHAFSPSCSCDKCEALRKLLPDPRRGIGIKESGEARLTRDAAGPHPAWIEEAAADPHAPLHRVAVHLKALAVSAAACKEGGRTSITLEENYQRGRFTSKEMAEHHRIIGVTPSKSAEVIAAVYPSTWRGQDEKDRYRRNIERATDEEKTRRATAQQDQLVVVYDEHGNIIEPKQPGRIAFTPEIQAALDAKGKTMAETVAERARGVLNDTTRRWLDAMPEAQKQAIMDTIVLGCGGTLSLPSGMTLTLDPVPVPGAAIVAVEHDKHGRVIPKSDPRHPEHKEWKERLVMTPRGGGKTAADIIERRRREHGLPKHRPPVTGAGSNLVALDDPEHRPGLRRAMGYARVSTEGQADNGISLDAQAEKIRGYCMAHDLSLEDIAVDAGASGRDLDRPGMIRLLQCVRRREVDVVIVAKLDRITRSVRDLGWLIDEFKLAHVEFASVADHIDTTTASGRLVLNIMGTISQWEREVIGERTSEALQQMKKQGKRVSRHAPFGWQHVTNPLDMTVNLARCDHEQEAIVLSRLWRQRGASYGEIAKWLFNHGYMSRAGTMLSRRLIGVILRRDEQRDHSIITVENPSRIFTALVQQIDRNGPRKRPPAKTRSTQATGVAMAGAST